METPSCIPMISMRRYGARIMRARPLAWIGWLEPFGLKRARINTGVGCAGDTFHGLTLINLSRGSNMAMLMNIAGFDAMTPGNHDFNFGSQRLIELAGMLNFPVRPLTTYEQDTFTTK